MDIHEKSLLVREVCNGILAISAALLVLIFVHHIFQAWRRDRNALRDTTIMAAVAITVLLFGHAVRAGSVWLQYIWVRNEWAGAEFWLDSIEFFLLATGLILVGKIMMVRVFAPHRWGARFALFGLLVSILVPILMVVVTS